MINKSEYKKANYDRLELILHLGWKSKIKEIATSMGISVNDYVCRLIKADIDNDHKVEDLKNMLLRWEVKEKYHKMIESASYTKSQGYYIRLKKDYMSDYTNSNEIICKTNKELRHVMQLTHPVRTKEEMCGFDSITYEQLLRWQVPKCYFGKIENIADHQIIFKNDEVWNFKSVNELRYMWKQKNSQED